MDEIDIYDIFGYSSGILFAGSLIPQLYKSYKTKELNDISICWQLIFILGLIFLFLYSFHNNLKPVYIPAIIETSFMFMLLIMKLYYDNTSTEIEIEDDNREYP